MSDTNADLAELTRRATAWRDDDPDEITRAEVTTLLTAAQSGDSPAIAELTDAFRGFLEFGTAGLRGAIGAGPNRMNRSVVIRAAAGLSIWLNERADKRGSGPGAVVIGFDARHRSDDFARDTAAVATGAGLSAMVLPRPLPTPVLAFALRHLGAAAGVMVTASHNPPQDNGYKVYVGRPVGDGYEGSQIVPPVDSEIAFHINEVTSVASVHMGQEWLTLDDSVVQEYISRTVALAPSGPRDIRIAYTPLHGVGGEVILKVLGGAGFDDVHVVADQFEPDPDFPTVNFPNPEEPGAIDRAIDLATEISADLVIANDPDADRCAAAVAQRDGTWRMLRGDEVGVLLGWWVLQRAIRNGTALNESSTFANSIVSSSMLSKIAASAGVTFKETLTGFKWLARLDNLAFAYEEALGYCVDSSTVRDKDGISAALLLAELAAALKSRGRTVWDVLDDLAIEHGLHITDQLSIRVSDLSKISSAMHRLRTEPPTALGGLHMMAVEDLAQGVDGLPPTDGLRFRLPGVRVIARPSGTEPKLKVYLEVIEGVEGVGNAAIERARARATDVLARVKADLAPLISG
jgi:phosphomannomutase